VVARHILKSPRFSPRPRLIYPAPFLFCSRSVPWQEYHSGPWFVHVAVNGHFFPSLKSFLDDISFIIFIYEAVRQCIVIIIDGI